MKPKRHNYKNLNIWKLGLEIVFDVSDIIKTFPNEEKFALASQMNRSAISIPSNIAEGSSRTVDGFKHFINISIGSSFELMTQILIANHKIYLDKNTLKTIEEKIENFQRMASGFQNQLN